MSFIHLQVTSGFSFFESTNTIEKLVERANELNFSALALTDTHVLYGAVAFYQACKKYQIKPIIGMSVNIITADQNSESCILLAKNNDGYKNIIHLSTYINTTKKDGILFSELHKFVSDLICILPASTSRLAQLLIEPTFDHAQQYVDEWKSLFNDGDFYLGVEDHGEEKERMIHRPLQAFHELTAIPVVAIQDVRYLKEDDAEAFDCLQSMKNDQRWTGNQLPTTVKHRHLRSQEEMKSLFASFWPEAIRETIAIGDKCNVKLELDKQLIPSYPVPNDYDAFNYLSHICWQQAEERYGDLTVDVKKRLTYELSVIESMKFADYFLIVWDFITFAKNNNILVGPGRGSSAGSIVSYVLGITEVDPLEHDLLFERFLNPERVTMPDIDIDFPDHRRDEVINYVREKYGKDHVAQIVTFGTFAARSIIRELIKTIGINQQDANFILRHIPIQGSGTIRQYVRESNELKEYIKQSTQLRQLFSIATKLEGLPRHISTHAAGIVISDDKLTEHTPLTIGANDTRLTQFAMNDLETIGLLKIDLLGLRNLSLLERIIHSIEYHLKEQVSIQRLPVNDAKTFHLLQHGKTNGIFQLESHGMKQVLQQLKPTNFQDIVAVNALYRPGPMDYIPMYINRKHGKEQVIYPHDDLEPILKSTFGVLVYQEQIIEIAHKIAGLSYGEADILRRAMSTKKVDLMNEQKENFILGCIENGYDQKVAEQIFAWILKFSNYGFPKSHATAYSKISYELAYLKAHYPAFFFAELLSSVMNEQNKANEYIKEARSLNIAILPPSINHSIGKYTVKNGQIIMGLLAIKGIGYQTVKEIIRARKAGPFKDLFDFCLRVSLKVINRSILEKLILAGAFDHTYDNRKSLLASIDQAMEQGILFSEFTDQPSLLKHELELKANYSIMNDFTQMEKLANEKELLGIYISSHPLSEHRDQLIVSGFKTLEQCKHTKGRQVQCAVIIQTVKKIRTKRGDPMAFITLSDETSDMEAVVFPELYRNERRWLKEEMLLFVTGKTDVRNQRMQMILDMIEPFNADQLETTDKRRLFIKVTNSDQFRDLKIMRDIANKHAGNIPVIVYIESEKKTYKLSHEYALTADAECLNELKAHFGHNNVALEK